MRIGLIDLGSNTIRLVAYDITENGFVNLFNEKEMLELLSYIEHGALSEEGFLKMAGYLENFYKTARLLNCDEVHCFATASLRAIDDLDSVLEQLEEKAGLKVEVITGRQEAYYDYLGLTAGQNLETGIGCDLGGGSCQLFTFADGQLSDSVSLGIGCLKMYQKFVKGVLPKENEAHRIYKYAKGLLNEYGFLTANTCPELYVMGGSGRGLAKIHASMYGQKPDVEGYRMKSEDVSLILETIDSMGIEGTRMLSRLVPDRLHTIVPAMHVIRAIARATGIQTLVISKRGVREGYLAVKILKSYPELAK